MHFWARTSWYTIFFAQVAMAKEFSAFWPVHICSRLSLARLLRFPVGVSWAHDPRTRSRLSSSHTRWPHTLSTCLCKVLQKFHIACDVQAVAALHRARRLLSTAPLAARALGRQLLWAGNCLDEFLVHGNFSSGSRIAFSKESRHRQLHEVHRLSDWRFATSPSWKTRSSGTR